MSGKKNLLEAFQSRESSGPAAPAAPSAPRLPFEGRAVGSAGARRGLALLALLLVTFALGYALGRRGAPETQAGAGEVEAPLKPTPRPVAQPRSFDQRAEAGQGSAATSPGATRIEDSALFDPSNQYTIVAGAYSKAKTDYAWATHDHLLEEGLAVFPPVASGNLLIVLVGTAANKAGLDELLARVKRLERDGKKVYDDAYVHPIDKLISRNLTKD